MKLDVFSLLLECTFGVDRCHAAEIRQEGSIECHKYLVKQVNLNIISLEVERQVMLINRGSKWQHIKGKMERAEN